MAAACGKRDDRLRFLVEIGRDYLPYAMAFPTLGELRPRIQARAISLPPFETSVTVDIMSTCYILISLQDRLRRSPTPSVTFEPLVCKQCFSNCKESCFYPVQLGCSNLSRCGLTFYLLIRTKF